MENKHQTNIHHNTVKNLSNPRSKDKSIMNDSKVAGVKSIGSQARSGTRISKYS